MSKTKEILALTKKLVRFKTTSDNIKEINKCADFIVDYFKKNKGSIIKKYKIDKKPALVITFRKTKKPELFLARAQLKKSFMVNLLICKKFQIKKQLMKRKSLLMNKLRNQKVNGEFQNERNIEG